MTDRNITDLNISISLATPRGFCAGVDRAIEIVERAIQNFGSPGPPGAM